MDKKSRHLKHVRHSCSLIFRSTLFALLPTNQQATSFGKVHHFLLDNYSFLTLKIVIKLVIKVYCFFVCLFVVFFCFVLLLHHVGLHGSIVEITAMSSLPNTYALHYYLFGWPGASIKHISENYFLNVWRVVLESQLSVNGRSDINYTFSPFLSYQ